MIPKLVIRRSLIARVLWRIESDLSADLSLTALAAAEGVSPFHLSRAFAQLLGWAPTRYIRARRMTEAARMLRAGSEGVTHVALEVGYDSHEGFTRAFSDHFGLAPRTLRTAADLSLPLQEPLTMTTDRTRTATMRVENHPGLEVLGLADSFTMDTRARIPALWGRLASGYGDVLDGVETFGVCFDHTDDGFRYLAGARQVPQGGEEMARVKIPAGRYAVMDHEGPIAEIGETWDALFDRDIPEAGLTLSGGPEFEHYAADFDPEKPGKVSVWIPVKDA